MDLYRDRDKKRAAFQSVAKEMQDVSVYATVDEIRKKIDTLRNQYRRELRKKEKSEKSGAATADIYTPTLWCFDSLSFLNDGDTIGTSVCSMDLREGNEAGSASEILTQSDHEVRIL